MLGDDSEEKLKFSRKRKGVIVKVKTTFEGTKTLLAASTGKKIQLERCHLLSTLFPSNTKKSKWEQRTQEIPVLQGFPKQESHAEEDVASNPVDNHHGHETQVQCCQISKVHEHNFTKTRLIMFQFTLRS